MEMMYRYGGIRQSENRDSHQPPPAVGLYNWYSWGWGGYYESPRVYQYEVYISETSLYDMVKDQVVWSGTAQTTSPGNIDKEIKSYAEIMVGALKQKKLIEGPSR